MKCIIRENIYHKPTVCVHERNEFSWQNFILKTICDFSKEKQDNKKYVKKNKLRATIK